MSYSGLVTKIKLRPHPNADKLALGQCGAYQVVVGKDTPDEALGVFFCVDGQLDPEFCKVHDLITRKDELGNRAGGYFSENRKVRCQKLRGEKSEGFWMPISCLEYTGVDISTLREGEPITAVNGHEICRKYFTPATIRAMGNKATKQRKECLCFAKHFDTEQFKREADRIPAGARLIITEKLHGTSARVSHAWDTVQVQLPWYKRWINRIYPFFATEKSEWAWLNGTRNTVLEHKSDPLTGYYGSDPFRIKITDPLRGLLHKGEVIYGEIVGYTESGAGIMGGMGIKDKELIKLYGKEVRFSYGNEPPNCSFYVYRITMTNVDGVAVDLCWEQVKIRCAQLGLKHVPEMVKMLVHDDGVQRLRELLDNYIEGPSLLDSRHFREGVCVRWESYPTCKILKHKSFTFLNAEDEQKSADSFVDTEETA